jgi:hypothetical protein
LLVNAGSALAEWQSDGSRSAPNLFWIKNDAVAQVHGFGSMTGRISNHGKAELSIDPGSLQVFTASQRLRVL